MMKHIILFSNLLNQKIIMDLLKRIELQFAKFNSNFFEAFASIYQESNLDKIIFGKKPRNSIVLKFTVFDANVL